MFKTLFSLILAYYIKPTNQGLIHCGMKSYCPSYPSYTASYVLFLGTKSNKYKEDKELEKSHKLPDTQSNKFK